MKWIKHIKDSLLYRPWLPATALFGLVFATAWLAGQEPQTALVWAGGGSLWLMLAVLWGMLYPQPQRNKAKAEMPADPVGYPLWVCRFPPEEALVEELSLLHLVKTRHYRCIRPWAATFFVSAMVFLLAEGLRRGLTIWDLIAPAACLGVALSVRRDGARLLKNGWQEQAVTYKFYEDSLQSLGKTEEWFSYSQIRYVLETQQAFYLYVPGEKSYPAQRMQVLVVSKSVMGKGEAKSFRRLLRRRMHGGVHPLYGDV